MTKLKEWLWRYAPANITATIFIVIGTLFAYKITSNKLLSAYLGTFFENIGYYGVLLSRDVWKDKKKHRLISRHYGFKNYLKRIHHLILEFGLAELGDSFFIRPFCIYLFPLWIKNYALGIIVGKYVADFLFYIPTIIAYELKKKYLKN